FEVRFHHLKAFTKGMLVVWTFQETPAGVLVEIAHDLNFRVTLLAPLAEPIIGDFFIHHIANRTLQCMKAYLENKGKQSAARREGAQSSPESARSLASGRASRIFGKVFSLRRVES